MAARVSDRCGRRWVDADAVLTPGANPSPAEFEERL
jgi:hypothetical protein